MKKILQAEDLHHRTITAYHPFSSTLKTDGTISFYRKADQSADEDYLASDLLWLRQQLQRQQCGSFKFHSQISQN